jgi:hypothetical protein
MEPFDTTRPNIARVWDYYLGGKDNFAADRELAGEMLALYPPSAQMARENRQFLGKAVAYVAGQGIGQFIDVGAGLPTAMNTHDVAGRINSAAKIAYVDNDPVVLSHARALLATAAGVVALRGDMRDPGAILTDPGLTGLISLTDPVCVLLAGVLHFADAGTARQVATAFTGAIPAGSYVIISVGTGEDNQLSADYRAAYTGRALVLPQPRPGRELLRRSRPRPPGRGARPRLAGRRRATAPATAAGNVPGRRGKETLNPGRFGPTAPRQSDQFASCAVAWLPLAESMWTCRSGARSSSPVTIRWPGCRR